MRRHTTAAPLLLSLTLAAWAPAQVYLIRDLNTTPGGTYNSTAATGFAPLPGGRLGFWTRLGLHATDGTPAGTGLLYPSLSVASPVVLGSRTLFLDASPAGSAAFNVWATDGTAAGTERVRDASGASVQSTGSPATLLGHAGRAWTYQYSGPHVRVWATDGTTAGTVGVESPSGVRGVTPLSLALLNGRAYFLDRSSTGPQGADVYRVDAGATPAITGLFRIPAESGTAMGPLFASPASLHYAAWGPGGAKSVYAFPESGGPATVMTGPDLVTDTTAFAPVGTLPDGTVVCRHGSMGNALWAVRATGVTMLTASSTQASGGAVAVGPRLFIPPSAGNAGVIWSTDGTPAGTGAVTIPSALASPGVPRALTALGGECWFVWDDGAGAGWWSTDGTQPGTRLRARLPGGTEVVSTPSGVLGGRLYFNLRDAVLGEEVWTVGADGIASIVADLSSANVGSFAAAAMWGARGKVYFMAIPTGASGARLYCTDGTAGGTFAVTAPGYGSGVGAALRVVEGATRALISTPTDLLSHDGSRAAAVRLGPAMRSAFGSDYNGAKPFACTVGAYTYYFTADPVGGAQLWRTDGTPAGTAAVTSRAAGFQFGMPGSIVRLGASAVLFFPATGAHGVEPWVSDGTPAGTRLVRDVVAGPSGLDPLTPVTLGDRVIFVSGGQTYVSDGTAAGTMPLALGAPCANAVLTAAVVGERMFYAFPACQQYTLRVTDGTPAGTSSVPGTDVRAMTGVGGRVVFSNPWGVWASDGTAAGTVPLTMAQARGPLIGGGIGVGPSFFTGRDGAAYFFTLDGIWRTDGTPAGTAQIRSLVQPPGGERPQPTISNTPTVGPFAAFTGGRLVFDGFMLSSGGEPWAADVGPAADCDANGVPDAIDVGRGDAFDANHDGRPDGCGCLADWDPADPFGLTDIFAFLTDWFDADADYDHSGSTELLDIFAFLTGWFAGCP